MPRESKLFQVRDNNKVARDVVSERDYSRAKIKNYGGGASLIGMRWNLNESAKADQIFEITIGKERALISSEEMLRYLRWI